MKYVPFTTSDLERVLEYMNENISFNSNHSETLYKKPRRTRRSKIKDKAKAKTKKIEYEPLIKNETMDKNKKLRLLVTTKCHNNCPMCCNKQFNFDTLPIVDRWDYEEVMITGGEPLSSIKKVRYLITLIEGIKAVQKAQGLPISKFYLYTSTRNVGLLKKIIPYLDGMVYTPHNIQEIHTLLNFTYILRGWDIRKKVSLRLNLFENVSEIIKKWYDREFIYLSEIWKVKKMEWIENCPIPEGEDFRRIYMLY